MNSKTIRILLALSAFLLSGTIIIAFMTSPYIGSAYMMLTKSAGTDLPALTTQVALPLLRPESLEPFSSSSTPVWVAIIWFLLITIPWGAFTWALSGKDVSDIISRWVLAMSLYLPMPICILLLICAGLVIAHARL